ncbi:MAG: hypothetical protein ACRDQX_01820 [Pseudonocardiaceae bacterium]
MTVMDYRTRDGLADYGFSIEFQSTLGWRAYIVFQPPSQDSDNKSPCPYQATDHSGRSYVDWPAKLDSLGEAKTVAALWAEINERYQRDRKFMRSAENVTKNPSVMKRRRPETAA